MMSHTFQEEGRVWRGLSRERAASSSPCQRRGSVNDFHEDSVCIVCCVL